MSTNHEVMSDRVFYAFAHPLQNRRFYLALVFSIILFPLIAVALIAGTVVLIVPFFALLLWIGSRVVFARLLGNSILVSNLNYPRINTIAEELKVRMGYQKPIFIFVYEQGNFNAYMRYFFFRRAVFLNSELLETGVSDDEVRWLVGRFVGYMRARRQAGVLGWVIRAAQHLVIFNIFLLPYERALVYTGDRLAVAAINGDIASAISAMQKLLVGRQLGYSVNPEGIVEQQRRVKGSFFAFLARLMSGFPPTTSRYVDLIVFAKAYFPAEYAKFEAANPGLPADLPKLAASPQSSAALPPGGLEAAGKPPRGWVWATGTMVVIVGLGFLAWNRISASQSDSSDWTPSASAASTEPAATPVTPAASPEPVATPAMAPAANPEAVAAPAMAPAAAAAAPAGTPALPPHVHLNSLGQATPDAGCSWVSNAPNDFRVQCN
jgi:hypothetical protein